MTTARGIQSSRNDRNGPNSQTSTASSATPMKLRNQREPRKRRTARMGSALPPQHDFDAAVLFAAFRRGVGRHRIGIRVTLRGDAAGIAERAAR